jgi:hypothetical protein
MPALQMMDFFTLEAHQDAIIFPKNKKDRASFGKTRDRACEKSKCVDTITTGKM